MPCQSSSRPLISHPACCHSRLRVLRSAMSALHETVLDPFRRPALGTCVAIRCSRCTRTRSMRAGPFPVAARGALLFSSSPCSSPLPSHVVAAAAAASTAAPSAAPFRSSRRSSVPKGSFASCLAVFRVRCQCRHSSRRMDGTRITRINTKMAYSSGGCSTRYFFR